MAEETLVLETAAGFESGAKVAEVIESGQRTIRQGGKLEGIISTEYEHLNLSMQESLKLFTNAEKKLKSHQGKYMPEFKIRELIHETGIPTFPRPKGIPKDYRVKLSDKGAGMKYVHPKDEGTYVRVMPGIPHSKNPYQRKPYISHRINGRSVDKFGKFVHNKSGEAHIPLEEFIYRNVNYYE